MAARGHEIGCHGHDHRHLYRLTPDEFREDVRRCLEVIATICEVEPLGYRAPWFSINRTTSWAFGILRELGFRYDSSLFDSPRLRNRIRPVPTHPFRVEDELWEFPIAVARRGRLVLPLGGGTYWRLLPAAALRRGLDSVAEQSTLPVLYFHPYELAPETLEVVLPAGAGPTRAAAGNAKTRPQERPPSPDRGADPGTGVAVPARALLRRAPTNPG